MACVSVVNFADLLKKIPLTFLSFGVFIIKYISRLLLCTVSGNTANQLHEMRITSVCLNLN